MSETRYDRTRYDNTIHPIREKKLMESNYTYRHFDSIAECILFSNNSPQKVAYFCCGGKGVALEGPERKSHVFKSETKGTCHICFLDEVSLVSCHTCVNTLCGSCLERLNQKICPYCRSNI